MAWSLFVADYYAVLELFAATVAVLIFVSSLDDLFIDLWYWTRRIYRALTIDRQRTPMTAAQLREKSEQAFAIMVPAWQEADVIAHMIESMVEVLEYANYVIFIGTYPNDTATVQEVERMQRRYKQLRRVEVPHPGPTCKADCLNWVVEAVSAHEQEQGMEFAGVVLHDSEDVLHPLELKFFNYLVPRKDMIQLPVASLEREWFELVAGTYMDEFAECHAKDMVVRESVAGVVPSAGVGTCFSRKALRALVGTTHSKPFNIDSLTEDYDVGNRLAQLGMHAIFGVFPVTYRVERHAWIGRARNRELTLTLPLCVREFFPDTFVTAYRQRARWVLGIGLQSWEQIKWRGSFAARYLLLHDRKGTVTSLVTVLAYLLVLQFLVIELGYVTGWWSIFYPSRFTDSSWWRTLIVVNLAFLVNRCAHRVYFTTLLYGWEHGLMSLPRMVVGNFVNFMAVLRAWRLFLSYLFRGKALVWDKTMHDFPTGQTQRRKQRLGYLLQAWQAVDAGTLDKALVEQKATQMPLGRILVSNGWLDEETLAEAIAYQADLPRAWLSAEAVLDHADVLPFDFSQRHRAVCIEVGDDGRAVLAVASPLDDEALAGLATQLGQPVRQRIVRESEIAIALRLLRGGGEEAFDRLQDGQAGVPLLGDMLIEQRLLGRAAFDAAMLAYRPGEHGRIGDYLVERGVLPREVIERVVAEQRRLHAEPAPVARAVPA